MDVLAEILGWSKDRPEWQRDALRRLVLAGELDNADIEALTEICKSVYGLAAEQTVVNLGKEHLPEKGASAGRVNVHSIYHKRGVNALAADQILNFGLGLTVVYGDNAAGKSGYTRIFKSACRARGTEDILGNVLSRTPPLSPIVSIKYTVGDCLGPVNTSGHNHVIMRRWNSRKPNTNGSRHTCRCSAATSAFRTSRCSTPSCMSPSMAANGAGYPHGLATGTPSTPV